MDFTWVAQSFFQSRTLSYLNALSCVSALGQTILKRTVYVGGLDEQAIHFSDVFKIDCAEKSVVQTN